MTMSFTLTHLRLLVPRWKRLRHVWPLQRVPSPPPGVWRLGDDMLPLTIAKVCTLGAALKAGDFLDTVELVILTVESVTMTAGRKRRQNRRPPCTFPFGTTTP